MTKGVTILTEISDYPHLKLVDNKNASGFHFDINKKQFENFVKFKQEIIKQGLVPNFNKYDDYYCLKFLRARKFDLEKTLIMFKKFLDWRKKEDVDNIDKNFQFNERMEVKRLYPHGYHKIDKMGRPIYIEILSKVDLNNLFKVTTEDRLVKYYIQEYEWVMKYRFKACSKLKGEVVDQSCTILDLKGIGVGMVVGKTKKFLEIATSVGQDYYPENLGIMFLINTSFLFSALWALVKGFIDPKTRNKMKVEKTDYYQTLVKYIDEENIPSFFGGKCTCSHIEGGCLFSDIGPWNPEGGLPPRKDE